jgi:hypothetical protein
MLSASRFAGILAVILTVCGPAWAQPMAPAGSGVKIDKVVVENGLSHTVKYYVTGGSPKLQALVRRVEWAENELTVIEQLQGLKQDTVVNDRRIAAFRTAQLTNPFNPPGYVPFPVAPDHGSTGASPLQKALTWQLAAEATPQAALQQIDFLEQMQTQLEAELKALPAQEKKEAQGPIDALRPRLAALTGSKVPSPQPQPAAPPQQVSLPAATYAAPSGPESSRPAILAAIARAVGVDPKPVSAEQAAPALPDRPALIGRPDYGNLAAISAATSLPLAERLHSEASSPGKVDEVRSTESRENDLLLHMVPGGPSLPGIMLCGAMVPLTLLKLLK